MGRAPRLVTWSLGIALLATGCGGTTPSPAQENSVRPSGPNAREARYPFNPETTARSFGEAPTRSHSAIFPAPPKARALPSGRIA